MAFDVCVVGEINPDLILYGLPKLLKPEEETLVEGFRFTLGSSSAIFAHNLAVLGTRVAIVSKIGDDALGKMAADWLASAGVDLSRVRRAASGTATGLSVILNQPEHRFILTYPGTMFELTFADLDLDFIFSARHLHVSSFFLHRALRPRMAELFREAKTRGLSTSLDTNDDPEGHWAGHLSEVLPYVDILFPNEREAKKNAGIEDLNQAVDKLAQCSRGGCAKRPRTLETRRTARGIEGCGGRGGQLRRGVPPSFFAGSNSGGMSGARRPSRSFFNDA